MTTWAVAVLIIAGAAYRFLREGPDGVTPTDLMIGTALIALVLLAR